MGGTSEGKNTLARYFVTSISRLFTLVGKPFFFVLFLLLTILFALLQVPINSVKRLNKLKLLIKSGKKNGSKGTVFTSKWFSFKILINRFRKKIADSVKQIAQLLWKIEVFTLAIKKLAGKIRPDIKIVTPRIPFSKVLTFMFSAIFLTSFFAGVLFWQLILKDLPSASELSERKIQVSTKIYDRNHELLYTIYKDKKRTPVALDKIPAQVKLATIVAEDQEFYSHPGFSIRGILRAIFKDLREGRLTGGSTITQQLVKNALLTPERTIIRKIKEVTLAIQVERAYTKDKILEMYLNEVPYGGAAYGIEEAANTFFDKDVSELTLGESALLAGLPQSPTKYSPFGDSPENAFLRQKEILRKMVANGFITEGQREAAEKEEIEFAKNTVSIKAPHFVFFVRDILEEKYGKEVVEQGGLEVTTSLDYRIQKMTEQIVSQEIDKLKNLNVGNAAVVVMNPASGEILAMVGSKDFFDSDHAGNVNVTTRPRQPGSSIKVVNYAYALSNGLTPATIIPDTPTTFKVDGQPPYSPKNYEGEFRGNITLRSALAESRNIPAVKVLASYGVPNMIDMGKEMGISTWTDPKNYGLSLTLGGGEVKLLDLTRVFATLANFGKRPDINPILNVSNYEKKHLEEFKCSEVASIKIPEEVSATVAAAISSLDSKQDCGGKQVLDPRIAYLLTDILKDNSARSPSFGSNSLLVVKNHPEVSVKTGTSNDLRDNITVGYTKDYVVSVWIGNNDNSEMSRIASGVTGATPIFNKIMTALLSDTASYSWTVPEGLINLPICPFTGTLACEGCPIKMEWFLEENKPDKACSQEWFEKKDEEIAPSISPDRKRFRNQYFENILNDQMNKIKKRFNH